MKARRPKPKVILSEATTQLLQQIPAIADLPVLPTEQIEVVAEELRKRLRQRVGLARAEEWRREQEQIEKTGRVTLGPGLEGVLTVAGKDTAKVSFFEILVDGRPYFAAEEFKPLLEDYLASVPGDTVDVTFLHSSHLQLEPTKRGRRKAQQEPSTPPVAAPPSENYNCTVRVPKTLALEALEDKITRFKEFAEILLNAAERQARGEQAGMAQAAPETSDVQSKVDGHP